MCEYRWLVLFILVSRQFYPVGSTQSKDANGKRQPDSGSDGTDSLPVGKSNAYAAEFQNSKYSKFWFSV